ncbi:unnamed protein product [Musa acuminata var. zebrina]
MLGRHLSCFRSISRNVEVLARLARGAGEPSLLCWVESKEAKRILIGRRPPPELPCPFPNHAEIKLHLPKDWESTVSCLVNMLRRLMIITENTFVPRLIAFCNQ